MNEKGFTLVEVLAVITVLLIVMLVAIPSFTKSIKNNTELAYQTRVNDIIEAATAFNNNYKGSIYQVSVVDLIFYGYLTDMPLDPRDNSEMNGCVYINKGDYSYDSSTCSLVYDPNGSNVEEIVTTFYQNGTPIYFNPNTNKLCSEENAISTTGTRSGCMKWYTFNDTEGSTTVNMILDHNTTSTCTYEGLVSHLKGDTSEWKSNLKPRNITANEIAKIVGHTTWNSDTAAFNDWFYLDSKNQTQTKNASNPSDYDWLFNNLNKSKTYGGTKEDNNTYNYVYYNSRTSGSVAVATTYAWGYWTITSISLDSSASWGIYMQGTLGRGYANNGDAYGVRPVITVSKTLIEQ